MLLRSLRRWSWQKFIFFHFSTTFTTPWSWKKMIFYLLLLRWLRHDSDKKKFFFATTLTAPWLWQKIKLFFIQTPLSLHNYHKDKICFAIATTFTMPWSRQKFILFLFQHYFHYTIVMRIKLLHNYHERKPATYFPSGSSVVLKDPYMIQQFNRQEFQWRGIFFPQEIQCF